HDAHAQLALRHVFRDAADRAARAHAGHADADPALGLLPDLRPGGLVVRFRVARIEVLVGLTGAGYLMRQAVRDRVVRLRRGALHVGWAVHDIGAVYLEQPDLLGRLLVR